MKNILISLIPAKKRSSRLKNKNLMKYRGSSLLNLAIKSSKNTKEINETYVSSDSQKILNISKKLGAIPINRSASLCKKDTRADEVIYDFIKKIKNKYCKNTILIYLQPTSPKRKSLHIRKAIKIFLKNKKKTLVSVAELKEKRIIKSFFYINKKLKPVNKKYTHSNDQYIPKILYQNGAIYIFTIKSFLKNKCIPQKNIIPFIMSNKDSLDINILSDLKK
jgi:CMP-N-acetylneuraminic acid synthetase